MSKSSIYNSYVDADFDPIPKSSTSSSSLSSSSTLHQQQQPTQSQQSSRSTARQRSSQAERWKQLQDLGQHIEEATTWSRRRAEFVTTTSSSRFRHNLDSKKNGNSPMTASSVDMEKTDSTLDDRQDSISGPSSKVNLREASLEGLEGLIAASAQRLVNYNLKKQSEQYINTISTDDTTCTKSTKGSYQQRQDYKGDNDFDSTSPTSATSSYNSLHKDTNTISSLSPPSDHHHQQQQQQQQQEKSIINNASPPIPSLSNTINSSTSKRISSHKKYLQRTLPASLSSHHQMVDKEKFSLVSPTSPSLSFRRSYQMTPPPAPIVTSTSRQKRPSKINTLHQQQPVSSPAAANNDGRKRQQHYVSSSSSLPPSPIHNNTSSSKTISSSRLSSSISSGALSKMALMRDPTSAASSASSSSSSSSPSSSPSATPRHLRKSMSPQQKQQRSSMTSSTTTISSSSSAGGRRIRTISTLGQSALESTTSTGESGDKQSTVPRQRTRSIAQQNGIDVRKSMDTTCSPRQQRTRHVSLLSKPSALTTTTPSSPSLPRSRKTSMVTLSTSSRKQHEEEVKVTRSRVQQPAVSPGKPTTTSRHRVSSTTIRPARDQTCTKTIAAPSQQTLSKGKQEIKGRKRGKTLPGSLATPPTMSLTLPPYKLEPISSGQHHQESSHSTTRSTAKTPTRIPLLMKSSKSQIADDDDDDDDDDRNTEEQQQQHNDDDLISTTTAKVGATSMIYSTNHNNNNNNASYIAPPGMMLPGSKSNRDPILKKQHSSVTMRTSTSQVTTGTTHSSSRNNTTAANLNNKNNKSSTSLLLDSGSTGTTRTRKISTISTRTGLGVSASVKPSEKSSDPRRNRVPTLHERLQALVQESNSWRNSASSHHHNNTSISASSSLTTTTSNPTVNKKEIVIRGGGHSTKTNETVEPIVFQGGEPMTPQQGLKKASSYLTDFEKIEMQKYPAIYFMGQPDCKKRNRLQQQGDTKKNGGEWNNGYDDERGDYHIVLRDHLAYRYEVLEVLGKGSFGQVLKCFDHHVGNTVAIKLIRNKKRFHTQAIVEINILKQLVQWDPDDEHHNVRMKDHFSFRNHLCLVFECLSINLYDYIKNNKFQGSSMGLIKRFTVQILQSLSLLHRHKLIHCDLKPENILLKSLNKSAIKVIDFGSSCLENEKVYTYIQSRFYRSPEVILGMNYGMAIDMWSVGCILAELYSGYPLFPGENEQEQLACIMEIMDVPEMALVEKSSRRKLFFDSLGQPRIVANSKGKKRYPRTKTLEQALERKYNTSKTDGTFALFVDFLHQCLQWDPARRITPDQAFHHPWILHSSANRSSSSKKVFSSSSSSLPL